MSEIKSITRKRIADEKLYNLAVEEDESYIANGIAVHNCRSILVPITKFSQDEMQERLKPSTPEDERLKTGLSKPISFYDGFRSPTKPRTPK